MVFGDILALYWRVGARGYKIKIHLPDLRQDHLLYKTHHCHHIALIHQLDLMEAGRH